MDVHIKQMFQRFGPVNGQIQTHRGTNRDAPCRRGVWAFPRAGHIRSDLYMVSHIYHKDLPKRLKNWDVEVHGSSDLYHAEYEAWFKKLRKQKKFRWSTIILELDKQIYTRLPPTWHPAHKDPTGEFTEDWYLCDVREFWDRLMHRHVYWSPMFGALKDTLFQPGLGSSQCDVYEVFIPM
jgi:hypothetical protein